MKRAFYQTISNKEIKMNNRSNIYRTLWENNDLSRQKLVSMLHLSLPTVTQNLVALENEGLVRASGIESFTGGRNAKTYSIVNDARIALGVDITKSNITTVAVDLRGKIIAKSKMKAEFAIDDSYYRIIGDEVEKLVSENGIDKKKILGIGFGVPGLTTPDNQEVFYGEILKFAGTGCKVFAKYVPYPAAIFNDAKAAGFAEAWINRSIKNMFYILLSNNVGGAVYIANERYMGDNIRSGEVGHIIIEPDGEKCYCGQKGCVDPYCSATVLSSYTNGNLELFFRKLDEGDEKALAIWEKYMQYLARAVINVRMLFDCPIVIGGYVGEFFDKYIDDLRILVQGSTIIDPADDFILPCKFKQEAIAAGAAVHFINDFLNNI